MRLPCCTPALSVQEKKLVTRQANRSGAQQGAECPEANLLLTFCQWTPAADAGLAPSLRMGVPTVTAAGKMGPLVQVKAKLRQGAGLERP